MDCTDSVRSRSMSRSILGKQQALAMDSRDKVFSHRPLQAATGERLITPEAAAHSKGTADLDGEGINSSPRMVAQRRQLRSLFGKAAQLPHTGLPAQLKSGIESLSGVSLEGVQVHYNSSKPAQLNASAYAQGKNIYLSPGHEQDLPHEAWHVVQQAQGRVRHTKTKHDVPINDEDTLEREADLMGPKALSIPSIQGRFEQVGYEHSSSNAYDLQENPYRASERRKEAQGETLTGSARDSPALQEPSATVRQLSSGEGGVIQARSNVHYFATQNFAHANPPAAGGVLNANAPVASGILANLDLNDPIRGSGVGAGIGAPAMADLNLNFPGRAWVEGHLLNSNLGGVGLDFNLFPITHKANMQHTWLVEDDVKQLLYNQPVGGNFALANHGYLQYQVDVHPVGGLGTATSQNPDVQFNCFYRTQVNQAAPVGPGGAPVWNAWQNFAVNSAAGPAAPAAVPATWTPFGVGLGVPLGGAGAPNIMLITVAALTFGNAAYLPALVAALGLAAPPPIPAGAVNAIVQLTGAMPTHKIIGWQF
jgi:hypothetical protein